MSLTLEQIDLLMAAYIGSNYDGLIFDGDAIKICSIEPLTEEQEQTIFELAKCQENNMSGIDGQISSADFAKLAKEVELSLTPKTAIAKITDTWTSSLAMDKGPNSGTDQSLSGNDFTVITAEQVLWDIDSNYDNDADDFVVGYDGIYSADGQIKLKSISNCTKIELALFKREEAEDDYWFILDEKPIQSGQTETLLSYATFFNFLEDERYCLKIKLYGENASATIDGNDDYTAWGYSFSRSIYK